MADIRHRVGIAAPQEWVYRALTTPEGLAGWWTSDVRGDPTQGGVLEFYFSGSEPGAVMEVAEATPTNHVRWRCRGGAEEWVGTDVTFDLKTDGGETVLLFTHANWREPVEFMYHCSTKWAYFMLSLKGWVEAGMGNAYPDDMKISRWG
ncbi:MAG TPA: SRPBCC domain-containing protein [Ktedonobacterales bacterium]|nr:SRPBCC domain-containing protein [Ktedonobacterales bacterium]